MASADEAGDNYDDLYNGFRRGDRQAAAKLFGLCSPVLYQRFVSKGCDPATASDLTQNVWMRLLTTSTPDRFLGNFVHEKNKVAKGILHDYFDATGRNVLHDSLSIDDQGSSDSPKTPLADQIKDEGRSGRNPLAKALAMERTEGFKTCFRQLPKEQRDALHLVYFDGHEYSYEQAAAVLGAGVEALKSRIRYAKTQLKRCLAALFPKDTH